MDNSNENKRARVVANKLHTFSSQVWETHIFLESTFVSKEVPGKSKVDKIQEAIHILERFTGKKSAVFTWNFVIYRKFLLTKLEFLLNSDLVWQNRNISLILRAKCRKS